MNPKRTRQWHWRYNGLHEGEPWVCYGTITIDSEETAEQAVARVERMQKGRWPDVKWKGHPTVKQGDLIRL